MFRCIISFKIFLLFLPREKPPSDQMDVSVDVTVTQTHVDSDFIDDGVPMEDIDDMEVDFLFSKYDHLDDNAATNVKTNNTTDVIDLSDDDEKTKTVPKNAVPNKVQAQGKELKPPLFRKILPKPPFTKLPQPPANRQFQIAIQSNIKIINNDLGNMAPPTVNYTVSTKPIVQPNTIVKKPPLILIEKNKPKLISAQFVKGVPLLMTKEKQENKVSLIKNSSLPSLLNKNKPLKFTPIPLLKKVKPNKEIIEKHIHYLKTLQTPSTSKDTVSEPPISDTKNCDNLKKKLVADLLNENPDFQPKNVIKIKQELLEPQDVMTEELECPVSHAGVFKAMHDSSGAIVNMVEETLSLPVEVINIKLETPDYPDEMQGSETSDYQDDAMHTHLETTDEGIQGISEMPDYPDDEIQEGLETSHYPDNEMHTHLETAEEEIQGISEMPDYPDDEIQEGLETSHYPDIEMHTHLETAEEGIQGISEMPDYPDNELQEGLETSHYPDNEIQEDLETPDYQGDEMHNHLETADEGIQGISEMPDYPVEEIQEGLEPPGYPDEMNNSFETLDEDIRVVLETPDYPQEEPQTNFNFIDKKLLSVTTVQLDDWSAVLSNSTRYCSLCQTLFPSRAVLDEHQAQWHPLLVPCVEEEGYYCQHCDTSFHDKYYLERHLQTHKNISRASANVAELKCFVCHVRFVSQPALQAHLNAEHVRIFSCDCGAEFPFQDLLDDHKRTVHAQLSAPTSDEPPVREDQVKTFLIQKTALFKCASCNVHFTDYWKAKIHYAYCNKNKSFGQKCPRCPKRIASFDTTHRLQHKLKCNLKTYTVNSVVLNVISECPKCMLHFKIQRKSKFAYHVKCCDGPSAEYFECCGLKFTEKRYLNHKNRHDSEREFVLVKYALYESKHEEGRLTTIGKETNSEPKSVESQDEAESSTQPKNKNKREKNLVLQKTALFECETCKANFTSYYRAQTHYNHCTNDTKHKKCPYCPKLISSKNHSYQHQMRCKLKSYTVNANQLYVLSECPKCRLHFKESRNFNAHVNECNGLIKDYIDCCGYKFSQYQYKVHKEKHNDADDRECIGLKYMLNVSRKRDEKAKQNVKPLSQEETERQEPQTSKCPICKVNINKYYLKKHMQVHSAIRPFKCNKCPYASKWESDLRKHKEKCRGNKTDPVMYHCGFCEYRTHNSGALKAHINAHARKHNDSGQGREEAKENVPRKKQQCPICGIRCNGLDRHMRTHSSVTPFKCSKCYYSTKWPKDLKKHTKKCRGPKMNAVWHNCDICEFKTRYKNTFQIHIKAHNLDERDSVETVQPRKTDIKQKVKSKKHCPVCGIDLKGLGLKRHNMQFHSNDRPFKCNNSNCYFTSKWPQDLVRHKDKCRGNATNVIWYDCGSCDFKSMQKSRLDHHIKRHGHERQEDIVVPPNVPPKKRKCLICGQYFVNIRLHMLVHSSLMPFKCDKCTYSAKQPTHLSVHKQKHCRGKKTKAVLNDCSQCQFKSKSKSALKIHINTHSLGVDVPTREQQKGTPQEREEKVKQKVPRKKRECPICGLYFTHLRIHMLVHSSVRPFKCNKCYFSSKRSIELKKHEQVCKGTKHNMVWFDCSKCEFKSRSKSSINTHINTHALECKDGLGVGVTTIEQQKVEPQKIEEKVQAKVPRKKRKCGICGVRCLNLKRHMVVHSSERPFKCEKCFFSTKVPFKLVSHKRVCRGIKPNTVWYDCAMCEFKTNDVRGLSSHMKSHAGDSVPTEEGHKVEPQNRKKKIKQGKRECKICGIRCFGLSKHMQVHSSVRPFKCNQCFYSSKRSYQLRQHKENCRGNKSNTVWYDCSICEFKTISKYGLVRHTATHTREYNNTEENKNNTVWYDCGICEFKTISKYGLVRHTATHTREYNNTEEAHKVEPIRKKSECHLCGFNCTDLKKHMFVHSLERPFKCKKCYYSTKWSSDLFKHERNCNGIEMDTVWHDCHMCEFKSKSRWILIKHIKDHERNSNDVDLVVPREEELKVVTSIRSDHSKKNCEGTNSDTVWHDCINCEFKTKCKQTLRRHIKTHGRDFGRTPFGSPKRRGAKRQNAKK